MTARDYGRACTRRCRALWVFFFASLLPLHPGLCIFKLQSHFMKLTRIILSLLLNIGQESSAKGTERDGSNRGGDRREIFGNPAITKTMQLRIPLSEHLLHCQHLGSRVHHKVNPWHPTGYTVALIFHQHLYFQSGGACPGVMERLCRSEIFLLLVTLGVIASPIASQKVARGPLPTIPSACASASWYTASSSSSS